MPTAPGRPRRSSRRSRRGPDQPRDAEAGTIAPAPWHAEGSQERAVPVEAVGDRGERDHLGHPMPAEAITIAGNGPRRAGSSRRWRMPAASSARCSRPPRAAMSGTARPARNAAEARNVAASSSATTRRRRQVQAAPATARRCGCRSAPTPAGRSRRQQVVGDEPGDEPAAGGAPQLLREAVAEGDRVDDPHVAGVVDGEQRAHQDGRGEVVRDQHAPAREPVGDHARERCGQAADRQEAERQPAGAGRAGQVERPDAEHDEQGAIAEQARGVTGEEAAEGGVAGEVAHEPSFGGSVIAP